jgi:hypothetical protein
LDQLLERVVIQCEIGDQALEPCVLVLKLAESAQLADLQPAVPGLPPVEGLLADPVPTAEVGRLGTHLGLLQHGDDLLLGESLSSHRSSSRRAS